MTPIFQWLVRWGCLVVITLGVLLHLVGMSATHWVKFVSRPRGYPDILHMLHEGGEGPGPNSTSQGVVTQAGTRAGLWRWCLWAVVDGVDYSVCLTPGLAEYPGWWRASQALAVVGLVMGMLSVMCAAMEVHYTRRGVRFSGLAVVCSICCFVTALGVGLSNGLYSSRYPENLLAFLLASQPGGQSSNPTIMYPPTLDWAFGFGPAVATLLGATGIVLLAFITRTYPTYHRTENVVV